MKFSPMRLLVPVAVAWCLCAQGASSPSIGAPGGSRPPWSASSWPRLAKPDANAPIPSADDAGWSSDFGIPSVDVGIFLSTTFRDEVVVAGDFRWIGEQNASNIAEWNGTRWSDLAGGVDGSVYASQGWHDRLIVGGAFAHAGGVVAPGVAAWDGRDWCALGAGLPGTVRALHVREDTLFAAVQLETSSAVFQWNGMRWRVVGDTLSGFVIVLSEFQGRLVIGGHLVTPLAGYGSGTGPFGPSYNVGMLVGGHWRPIGKGLQVGSDGIGDPSFVTSLAEFSGQLIAGGYFLASGQSRVYSLARWDGASWDSIPGARASWIEALAVKDDELLVCGSITASGEGVHSGVSAWDGARWRAVGDPLDGITSLTESHGHLIASGYFQAAGGIPSYGVAALSGGSWHPLIPMSPRMHGLASALYGRPGVHAFATSRDQLVVGGSFNHAAGPAGWAMVGPVAGWDGMSWSTFGGSALEGDVDALAQFHGDLYAAGSLTINNRCSGGSIARWDGHAWTIPGGGIDGQVYALAVYHDELYAAGRFTQAGDAAVPGIARWDGTSWRSVGAAGSSVSWIGCLGVWQDKLFAGGYGDGISAQALAAWNGESWSAVGLLGYSEVSALLSDGDSLVIGGFLSWGDPLRVVRVARWNGVDLKAMDEGRVHGFVNAFARVGSALYAGGSLFADLPEQGEGRADVHVARWDSTGWSPVGSGGPGDGWGAVSALAAYQDRLYVGGDFTLAGGKSSSLIARWDGNAAPATVAPLTQLAPGTPNPFQLSTRLGFELRSRAHVRLDILDVTGHRVARLVDSILDAGPHEIVWDPSRSGAPSGIYFANLGVGNSHRTTKLVLMR